MCNVSVTILTTATTLDLKAFSQILEMDGKNVSALKIMKFDDQKKSNKNLQVSPKKMHFTEFRKHNIIINLRWYTNYWFSKIRVRAFKLEQSHQISMTRKTQKKFLPYSFSVYMFWQCIESFEFKTSNIIMYGDKNRSKKTLKSD